MSRVIVHLGPNPSDERHNGLPAGVRGGKIWIGTGGIPLDPSGWQWIADDTASPYVYSSAGSGLTLAFRAQYFDRRMQLGPFSDPAVAVLTG